MNTATTIKGRIAAMSMTLALVVASLVSEASALPPIAGPLEPMVPLVGVTKRQCSPEEKAEVLAPATAEAAKATISCSLTLSAGDVVTKRLILRGTSASGVTVECNGATVNGGPGTFNYNPRAPEDMVEIHSTRHPDPVNEWRWERPENITLRNCEIIGSVAVWGMEKWTDEGILMRSSRLSGHVERVRNNAPRNIVFDHVVITGVGLRVPLYLHAGVSDVQMLDSEIDGSSGDDVNIYLDAESHHNTFRNNTIHAKTSKREVMAVDGSSYNIIANNYFSSLNNGGIYLYRNCGEGTDDDHDSGDGVIRHSTPSGNQIINNVFHYVKYAGDKPSIFVGARNGNRKYCDDDKGYPYGSSVSNYDHAQFNVVMQNQILKRSVSDMIKVGRPDINTPNYIDYNEGSLSSAKSRAAGCYVSTGYKNFIEDGQSIDLFKTPDGQPVCRGESRGDRGGPGAVTNFLSYNCNDGVLGAASDSSCRVSYVPFECQATGDNSGCQATAFCPAGTKIIGGRAACNLEFGTVSSTDLNGVPLDAFGGPIANFVKVVRASDKVSDGRCTLGGTSIQSGAAAVAGTYYGPSSASFGCSERDSNGGDCHIKGTLYCR